MAERTGTRPMPPQMKSTSRPFRAPSTGKCVPKGPRTPTLSPALRRCRAPVTLPTLRTTISKASPRLGELEMEMGASPKPGMDISANWPGMWPRAAPESSWKLKKFSIAVIGSAFSTVAGWGR